MGWAQHYIEQLIEGHDVEFRPKGHSMSGRIESGQLCTVVPVNIAEIEVGDIVLCKVRGKEYLLIVKAIEGERFQVGNTNELINGRIGPGAIFGKCVSVED